MNSAGFPAESETLISPFQVYEIQEVKLGNGKTFDPFKLKPLTQEQEFEYFSDNLKKKTSKNISQSKFKFKFL